MHLPSWNQVDHLVQKFDDSQIQSHNGAPVVVGNLPQKHYHQSSIRADGHNS